MALDLKVQSLREFLVSYPAGLKKDAPVKTGRLRDSIATKAPTLSTIMDIITVAVDYAIYANAKHHFVEKNDYQIAELAEEFADDVWDSFYEDNKTPNK
jgi:hypothetical protein